MCLKVTLSGAFERDKISKFFEANVGYRLSDITISTFYTSSITDCATKCSKEATCLSFNIIHDDDGMLCDLKSNSLTGTTVADVNAEYYGKNLILLDKKYFILMYN